MIENIGMMDEGYFVSRSEIINWVNNLLQLNIDKIEQLGSGAIYCQILDSIYPGQVPMQKVNFKAKLEYEFINNLKILQKCFEKLKIQRAIEVERLSKARYQDNLEFIQWLKRYYDLKVGNKTYNQNQEQYDPVARRGNQQTDFSFANKVVQPKIFKNINNISDVYQQPHIQPIQNENKKSSVPKYSEKKKLNEQEALSILKQVKKIVNNQQKSDNEIVQEIRYLLFTASLEKNENLQNINLQFPQQHQIFQQQQKHQDEKDQFFIQQQKLSQQQEDENY